MKRTFYASAKNTEGGLISTIFSLWLQFTYNNTCQINIPTIFSLGESAKDSDLTPFFADWRQISLVAYFDFDPALLCWISKYFAIASIIQLKSNVFIIFIFFISLRFIDTDKRVIPHSDLYLIYGIDHSIRKRIKGHEWHCHQISILEPGLGTLKKKIDSLELCNFVVLTCSYLLCI